MWEAHSCRQSVCLHWALAQLRLSDLSPLCHLGKEVCGDATLTSPSTRNSRMTSLCSGQLEKSFSLWLFIPQLGVYKYIFTEKLLVLFEPIYCLTIIYNTADVFLYLTLVIQMPREGSALASIC